MFLDGIDHSQFEHFYGRGRRIEGWYFDILRGDILGGDSHDRDHMCSLYRSFRVKGTMAHNT